MKTPRSSSPIGVKIGGAFAAVCAVDMA